MTLDVHGVGQYRVTIHAPAYQASNIALALAATGATLGNVSDPGAVDTALRTMTFPGRFELLRREPPLVLDGAHNPDAARVLSSAIRDSFRQGLPVIVLGILADKDAEGIVRALASSASAFVATENGSPRCLAAGELAALIVRVTGRETLVVPDLREAIAVSRQHAGVSGVVVTGSLYTVGAVKTLGSDIPSYQTQEH